MLNCNYTVVFSLLLPCCFSAFFHAADPILSPGDTDLIRDRQERLLQDQQKRLDELQQLLPNTSSVAKPELIDEARCFEVKDISL